MLVQRTKDPALIEARLLELAHTTDAKITAPALAYFAPCSLDDAAHVLDDLAGKGQLSMEIQDDGSIVYELLGRQQLKHQPLALVPIAHPPRRDASALLAAVLTVWIPGAGHLYAGRFAAAILWFLVVGAGYALILPGLILHLFCIASAASAARRVSAPPVQPLLAAA
jgi:TM2 domain-containing membrane protein YozV